MLLCVTVVIFIIAIRTIALIRVIYIFGFVISVLQINKKVMGMIEKAETEYKELIRKKEVR